MAITDIAAYAHLSEADIEALGYELDAIRRDIEDSRGESDAAYIRRTISSNERSMLWRACSSAPAGRGPAGSWGPRRWRLRRVLKTWRSATMSAMANGIG